MYTSYFSKMKKITGDYKFYCISRVCPKGVMAKMYGKLAPSADLLAKWKSGQITWEEYEGYTGNVARNGRNETLGILL